MIYLLEFITILIKMLQRFTRTFSTVKKTCLYDTLVESKGKIVEFAGILYKIMIRLQLTSSISTRNHKRTSSL